MAFCGNCGMNVTEGTKFCPGCGTKLPEVQAVQTEVTANEAPAAASTQAVAPAAAPSQGQSQPAQQTDFASKLQSINNTADTTADYTAEDIEQNKVMALLSYIGLLFLVPLFGAPKSKFARFHANQGLVLSLAAVAFGIVYGILVSVLIAISWRLAFLTSILGLLWIAYPVLAIIGIVNALNGKAKELPFIGKIKILK